MLGAQRILTAASWLLSLCLLKLLWDGRTHGTSYHPSDLVRNQSHIADESADIGDAYHLPLRPPPACPQTKALDDVLVVLKTGATEIYEKLPIHLATTFACPSEYLVYSDVAQQFGYVQVRDALALVSEDLRSKYEHMAQYRTLQTHVLDGGDAAEMKGEKSWGLDKWKFLPMISDAVRQYGTRKKWFVFIEADTYLSLHNLILWLQELDPQEAVYAGAQVMTGDTEFAHGGSGFLLSAVAANALADAYQGRQAHWEHKLADECCGDKLLAEVLLAADEPVRLHRTFPVVQGETLSSLDWSTTHWCRPAVTWHHVDAAGIDKLWQFEQRWRHAHGSSRPILFADYFTEFIEPRLVAANGLMRDWDNLSNEWVDEADTSVGRAHDSAAECEKLCRQHVTCLQWAWSPGMCRAG